MDRDFDRVAVPGQSLVNRVVHDFVNQVVQAQFAGGSYVHCRPFAHGVAPFQHGY